MRLFKKLNVPTGQKDEVTAVESWVVSWYSRHGEFSSDVQKQFEVFTNKEDAEKFHQQIKDAFRFLKHTSGTRTELYKTK